MMEPLIWKICDYTRGGADDCHKCPPLEHVSDYGPGTRGCRMMAEEAIAVVLAHLEPPTPANDPRDRDATPREREAVEGEASQPGPGGYRPKSVATPSQQGGA
jgi:hypothetical protein